MDFTSDIDIDNGNSNAIILYYVLCDYDIMMFVYHYGFVPDVNKNLPDAAIVDDDNLLSTIDQSEGAVDVQSSFVTESSSPKNMADDSPVIVDKKDKMQW